MTDFPVVHLSRENLGRRGTLRESPQIRVRLKVRSTDQPALQQVVPSLDCVHAFKKPDGGIKIVIDAHPPDHPRHGSRGSFVAVRPDWRNIEPKEQEEVKAPADPSEPAAVSSPPKTNGTSPLSSQPVVAH